MPEKDQQGSAQRMQKSGWQVNVKSHHILKECQALFREKEHPLPGTAEYFGRQLGSHINGLLFLAGFILYLN